MIEIYSARDYEWNRYLSLFEPINNQLHFTSEYHNLFLNPKNEPILFIYKEDSEIFFYPFIKRRVNKNYCDITSVFGYTGPLANSRRNDFLSNADTALKDYLYNENIISELIRFNPISDNHKIYFNSNSMNLFEIKDYVVIETMKSVNDLFLQFTPRLKTYIRKAEKKFNNIVQKTISPSSLQKFFELYKKHMVHLKADEYYLFTEEYFDKLRELVKKNGFLVFAEEENEMIAGLLFLNQNVVAYYHHGARDISNTNSSLLNKLLFWKAIEHLNNEQVFYCLLGGGVTNDVDDSLLKFKKDFGGNIKKLWLGKRVINQKAYTQICKKWENSYPELTTKYNSHIDKFHFTS